LLRVFLSASLWLIDFVTNFERSFYNNTPLNNKGMKQIEILRKTRKFLLDLIDGLTIEELNEIPAGFNNNIIWNLGHMIASQQGVCYKRAGLNLTIEEKYFINYKPDTKPNNFIDAEQANEIKSLFLSAIDQLEEDYNSNVFADYPAWTNRYGVEHKNIDDTINFLLFHDGLHVGYIMALKRIVKNNISI
jgi:DinB family protein